ncbi:hypothetical protein RPHASCH2410_CH03320 [Rhizobium phaseoli Ch24-10]|nr:hypothetical protein RPHASCH2410_CH03320 [Rhizobium phaseoli Ch24-10]
MALIFSPRLPMFQPPYWPSVLKTSCQDHPLPVRCAASSRHRASFNARRETLRRRSSDERR